MSKVAKKWISIALIGCCIFASSCMKPKQIPKVLKIGYTHYQPMNYMDEDQGKLVGFDVEFARQVCDELGYTPEFVEIIWDNKVSNLNAGTIDCIWNGMTITEELSAQILISDPYLSNRQVIALPLSLSEKFSSVFSLSSVAFENGGVAESLLNKGNLPTSSMREAATQSAALAQIVAGNAEAAVVDYNMAKCVLGKGLYGDLTYVEFDGAPLEYYGVGFRKTDRALCDQVNALIAKYKADGTFSTLEKKYLG